MKQVGTFEAKNQFSALLELVAQGEDVLITRHGKPVARLVPPEGSHSKENADRAVEHIRAPAKELNLGPFDWEEWKPHAAVPPEDLHDQANASGQALIDAMQASPHKDFELKTVRGPMPVRDFDL